jgi:hypothetical protein
VFLAGQPAPVTYVSRGDRRFMLVRPGPAIEPHLLGLESLLPTQLGTRTPRTGERALLVRLLVDALADAGLLASGGRWHRHGNPRRCALARAWLSGQLDREVALPVALVADAVGVDRSVLAAAVARAPSVPPPPRRRGPAGYSALTRRLTAGSRTVRCCRRRTGGAEVREERKRTRLDSGSGPTVASATRPPR